jgi:two-component system, response regulator
MHILLIGDDPRDLELARSALAAFGIPVDFASAPDEARAMDHLLRRGESAGRPAGNPVAIFLDLKLEDSRGRDMIAEIRRHRGLAHIPIVMLTTSRDEGVVGECYRRGANACMVKPVAHAEFAINFLRAVRYWAEVNVPPG